MTDLHPVTLPLTGLDAQLRTVVARVAERAGLDYRVSVAPVLRNAQDDLVLAAARELVTNAVRHAEASRVEVDLDVHDGRVVLVVADDGTGIEERREADAVQKGHIGLASLRERVEGAGGSLRLDGSAGVGTRATAILPQAGGDG